ncbi:MAG: lipoyl synthase [Chlamydiota bacterium]|jgi:lipoic acid synthetase
MSCDDLSPKVNKLPIHTDSKALGRFPSWLHRKLPPGKSAWDTSLLVEKYQLNTVCEEAKCPNRFECYSHHTATFLALGKHCTRNCGFCSIDFSKTPPPLAQDEPLRIALATKELGLKHVVITMVARDDLEDGGALQIAAIIRTIRQENPGVAIEVLTSDFEGKTSSIDLVLQERPEVFNHNIETVRALSPRVRHKATYERTLLVLRYAKSQNLCDHIKSGLMVGLGETKDQVEETLLDLYQAGCSMVTIGQYLQSDHRKLLVKEFVTPEQFKAYELLAKKIGIEKVFSGPFVRSSYHAHEMVENNLF